jgi:hypothetical protein
LFGRHYDQVAFDKLGLAARELIRQHALADIFSPRDLVGPFCGQILLQSQ